MTAVETAPELLISSDSHAQVSHDAVKAHLASKFHDEYDGAVSGLPAAHGEGRGPGEPGLAVRAQGSRRTPARSGCAT